MLLGRLLEGARDNVWGNVPKQGTKVAMRKALWGAPIELKGLTSGAPDIIITSHAQCRGALDTSLMMTALRTCGPHTLVIVVFTGETCEGVLVLSVCIILHNAFVNRPQV